MNRREEDLLREWIREELGAAHLSEGVADTLRSSILKVAKALGGRLDSKIASLRNAESASEQLTDLILDAPGGSKVVSSISQLGSQFKGAADDVLQHKFETPAANESRARKVLPVLYEINSVLGPAGRRRRLNEVGVFELVGLGLGLMGGIPMLLKGFHKVAKLFRMDKTSDLLKKMYETAHHIEEGFVDVVIPDRVSYFVYVKYQEAKNPEKVANYKIWEVDPDSPASKAIKPNQRIMSREEYLESDQKKKIEKGLYIVLLTPWLINGLVALKNFISNIINWAEGAATAVKGLEVGELASMTAELVQGGAAGLEDAAVTLSAAMDVFDKIS